MIKIFLHASFVVCMCAILAQGCSLEEAKSREIRAHTIDYDGVAHGAQARSGPRYCRHCHGDTLEGGINGEASCFTCHGLNWDDISGDASSAPEDHTVINGIFNHRTGLSSPDGVCTNCHGSGLEGDSTQSTPACLICHEKKW